MIQSQSIRRNATRTSFVRRHDSRRWLFSLVGLMNGLGAPCAAHGAEGDALLRRQCRDFLAANGAHPLSDDAHARGQGTPH